MSYTGLSNAGVSIDTSLDSIVIADNRQSIRGGYSLDVTGFTPPFIHAGHPIIEETATGQLKPMPVASSTAFASLPSGHTYAGILISTILTGKPMEGIVVKGTVNHLAFTGASVAGMEGYYSYAPILSAIKAALPHIDFSGDR